MTSVTVLCVLALFTAGEVNDHLAVLSSSEDQTVVSIHVPHPEWEDVTLNGDRYTSVRISGAGAPETPGEPDLPVFRFAIGVPEGRNVSVSLKSGKRSSYRDIEIPPVQHEALVKGRDGFVPGWVYDTADYRQPVYPRKRSSVILTGRIRSLDVAYIEVCPFEYYPDQRLLCLDHDMTVTIHTDTDPLKPALQRKKIESPGPMEPVLNRLLVNYDQAAAWRQGPPDVQLKETRFWDPPRNAYKLLVDHDGYYSITGQELSDAGVPIGTIDPMTIQLATDGEEIPIRLVGMDDNRFDPADRLEFIGRKHIRDDNGNRVIPIGGRFTETNVYWLWWGETDGLRMEEREVTSQGMAQTAEYFREQLHIEQDLNPFIPNQAAISFDRYGEEWFWGPPLIPGTGVTNYSFTLRGVAPVLDPVHMRVSLRGYTHPDFNFEPHHHAIVYLNSVQIVHLLWYSNDEVFYDSYEDDYYNPDLWPNSSVIGQGENTFGVEITGDTEYGLFDGAYTDWFELDYWRSYSSFNDSLRFWSPQQEGPGVYRYDVTGFSTDDLLLIDLTAAEILTGFEVESQGPFSYTLTFIDETADSTRYLALTSDRRETVAGIQADRESDLSALSGAEFVIITNQELEEQAARLGEGREFMDQQVTSELIDVEDIFDHYSFGIFDPRSIKEFLTDAYETWIIPPAFVLLFGDASWDYKLNSPTSDPSHRNFVPSYKNPAIDDFFANVDTQGGADSLLPDLYMSRIPVENADTARTVVDKILNYPLDSEGDWRENVFLIAGGYLNSEGYDSRQYFNQQCRNLARDWVIPEPAHYDTVLAFRPVNTHWENEFETTEDETLQVLFNEVGSPHVTYIGHGASWTWETMFWASDVENDLTNTDMLPMVNSMTCHTGRFANPEIDSFGEIWMWQPHGAVGFLGSTGWGFVTVDYWMIEAQFESIFRYQERVPSVAVLQSKLDPDVVYKLGDPMSSPLFFTWNGDPLIRLALGERPDWVQRPGDISVSPQPVVSGDTVAVSITVRNLGIDPGPSTTIRLFDAHPESGGVVLTNLSVPALDKAESTEVAWSWRITGDPGERGIFAWVNPDTAQQEGYRNDNTTEATFQVLEPIPDLVIADSLFWVFPEQPQVLDSVLTVSLIISNIGTGNAEAYDIRIVDSLLTSGSVSELADVRFPGLNRGMSETLIVSWEVTDLDAGDHVLNATVDWRNELQELNEDNNTARTTVHLATRAEIEAAELWISNPNPPEGDSLWLRGIWRNIGEAEARNFHVVLRNGDPDSGTGIILAEKDVSVLPGGASDTLETLWLTVGQVGVHEFVLEVDSGNTVSELDETNNRIVRTVNVVTGPDLIARDLQLNIPSPVEGDSARLSFSVRNMGMVDADSFSVIVMLDTMEKHCWRFPLAGLSQRNLSHGWLWDNGGGPGDHTVSVQVDVDSEVEETNEENNAEELSVHVMTFADLVVNIVPSMTEAVENEILIFDVTVENAGEASAHTISLKWQISASGESGAWNTLDSLVIPELPGMETYDASTQSVLDPGDWTIRAIVETPVTEQFLENNEDRCVVSVRALFPPDLVILSTTVVSDTVTVGEDARIRLSLTNSGEVMPDSGWVEIRSTSPDSMITGFSLDPVAPGDTIRITRAWAVPHGISSYLISTFSIPDDSNPEDNSATVSFTGVWPADLAFSGGILTVFPERPLEGDTVSVSLTVANQGERSVPLYTVALFRGDPSSGQSEIAELLLTKTPETGLDPDETRDFELKWDTPEEPGIIDLYIWLDAAQVVNERYENNNLQGISIEVLPKDFSVEPIVPIPSPASGETGFHIRASHDASVTVSLYTTTGRLVERLGPVMTTARRNERIPWYCRDRDGDRVANGIYLFVAEAQSDRTGETIRRKGKVTVIR